MIGYAECGDCVLEQDITLVAQRAVELCCSIVKSYLQRECPIL